MWGDFIFNYMYYYYRKSLCRNPQNDKKFHNFQRGYDKGYKIFIADENLFVCIIIYYNKNINFQWITKKYKNYKIKFSLKIQSLLIYKLGNKNHLKKINYQNFAHFMRRLRQRLLRFFKNFICLLKCNNLLKKLLKSYLLGFEF